MDAFRVTRTVKMPDLLRLSRYQKAPELGPKVLFFSGGSALNKLSRKLKHFTHNSIHMMTPFDSGGSSAKLRNAFNMPAIGDLRSRLVALADESVTGHPEVYRLFTYRFPGNKRNSDLRLRLEKMVAGRDPLVGDIPNPFRRLIRNQLGFFVETMPDNFNLKGASIGNLILAGGYLNNHQHLDPIIFLFSKLVGVQGTVRAVVNDDLHLGARLKDGSRIIGQHLMTGKEAPPLRSPISELYLCKDLSGQKTPGSVLRKKNRKLIESADLICFPPGSFYSSLVANFLPTGVGAAIAASEAPKVYVPNLGQDPEQLGMDLDDSVSTLYRYLRADAGKECPDERLLNFILVDSQPGRYGTVVSSKLQKKKGFQIVHTHLVSRRSKPYYDPELLAAALLSLT